jgi:hypothetical protein
MTHQKFLPVTFKGTESDERLLTHAQGIRQLEQEILRSNPLARRIVEESCLAYRVVVISNECAGVDWPADEILTCRVPDLWEGLVSSCTLLIMTGDPTIKLCKETQTALETLRMYEGTVPLASVFDLDLPDNNIIADCAICVPATMRYLATGFGE